MPESFLLPRDKHECSHIVAHGHSFREGHGVYLGEDFTSALNFRLLSFWKPAKHGKTPENKDFITVRLYEGKIVTALRISKEGTHALWQVLKKQFEPAEELVNTTYGELRVGDFYLNRHGVRKRKIQFDDHVSSVAVDPDYNGFASCPSDSQPVKKIVRKTNKP